MNHRNRGQDGAGKLSMHEKLKNERHHWWPQGLSKFWGDDTGHAHQLACNGDLARSLPKSFGAIRNDNNITFKNVPTVWDESFEKTFAKADDAFPSLISWLRSLASPVVAKVGPFAERLTPLVVTKERQDMIGECLASLIARSPSFRQRISKTAEYYRGRFGFKDPAPDKSLIGLSVRGAQKEFSNTLKSGGKFVVLFSGQQEFIFGDGFLHNFSSAHRPLAPRCLVPLTPEIAIFYTRPMQYGTYPKGLVLNLVPEEVAFVNRTVQVYANRFVFFRSIHPVVDEVFGQCQHLEFKYHQHPWLDDLERVVAETHFGTDAEFYPPGQKDQRR